MLHIHTSVTHVVTGQILEAIVLEYDKTSAEMRLKVTLFNKKTTMLWFSTKTGKQLVETGVEINWKLTAKVVGKASFDLVSWPEDEFKPTKAKKKARLEQADTEAIHRTGSREPIHIVDEVTPHQRPLPEIEPDLIAAKKAKITKFKPDEQ